MTLEALEPGDYRHRFDLQAPVRVRNVDGGYSTAWAVIRSVWTNIIPLDNPTRPARQTWSNEGREVNHAGQQSNTRKQVFMIRYVPEEIGTTWRMVKGSEVYNITEAMTISGVQKQIRIVGTRNLTKTADVAATYAVVVDSNGIQVVDSNGNYIVALI
jgi:head-tail adaptor